MCITLTYIISAIISYVVDVHNLVVCLRCFRYNTTVTTWDQTSLSMWCVLCVVSDSASLLRREEVSMSPTSRYLVSKLGIGITVLHMMGGGHGWEWCGLVGITCIITLKICYYIKIRLVQLADCSAQFVIQ